SFAREFKDVGLFIKAIDMNFAFKLVDARSDLHANCAFVSAVIDGLGNFRAGHARDDFPRIAEECPHLIDGLGDLECLLNSYCHNYEIPFSWSICHTFQGVIGMSMCLTPRCDNASTTALTNAAGDPTFGDSPTPFAPIG